MYWSGYYDWKHTQDSSYSDSLKKWENYLKTKMF